VKVKTVYKIVREERRAESRERKSGEGLAWLNFGFQRP
jgi:hypothetical protein